MAYPSKRDLLKKHPLFKSLGWFQLRTVSNQSKIVEYEKGEVIIEEGGPGDAFYIVVSGRCEAYTELKSGRNRVFQHYLNGDSFGEMPLLSAETHWCSVRALNDTLLLKIDQENFNNIVDNNPDISRELSARLARRVKELRGEKKEAKWTQIIGIGSSIEQIGKTLFGMNVSAALTEETGEPICLIDFSRRPEGFDIDQLDPESGGRHQWVREITETHEGNFDYLSATLPERETRSFLRPFFGGFVKQYNYVFVILPEGFNEGIKNVYLQCDSVYLLTNSDERVLYQTRLLINQIEEERGHDKEDLKVILARLPEDKLTKTRGVESQLNYPVTYRLPEITPSPGSNHRERNPLVRQDPDNRYSQNIRRIARQIGNVSVGLALGAWLRAYRCDTGSPGSGNRDRCCIRFQHGSSDCRSLGQWSHAGRNGGVCRRISGVGRAVVLGRSLGAADSVHPEGRPRKGFSGSYVGRQHVLRHRVSVNDRIHRPGEIGGS